jgi:hypothetical protein
MTTIPDFGLWYQRDIENPEFAEIGESLRSQGLHVELEARESSVYASLEWVIPTAVVIFVADKYFGTMVSEAAKEHYPVIRDAVGRIARSVFRRVGSSFGTIYATPAKKISSTQVHLVSVYARHRDGWSVRFMLDDTETPVENAVDEVFEVLRVHHLGLQSAIDIESAGVEIRQGTPLVFARGSERWVLVYPIKEK